MNISFKRFFMPYLNGPGCVLTEGCGVPNFPTSVANCVCETAAGGINELYFIPCTSTFTEANITDLAFWSALVDEDTGTLGRSGIGLGSIAKGNVVTERVGSCRDVQIMSITWNMTFAIKCFDKSSARSTCAKMNELVNNFDKYLLVARMCDGENTVLPVGRFTTSDFDWVVPDNSDETQTATLQLSWKEKGFPCTVDVAGLSTVLPKLS